MKKLWTFFLACAFLALQGCAASLPAPENKPFIPLDKANLQAIFEDNEGLEVFEGCDILFFPNLLMADNHLKIGLICKTMGRDWRTKYNWKRALSLVKKSLRTEWTEWGLALEQELLSLLAAQQK